MSILNFEGFNLLETEECNPLDKGNKFRVTKGARRRFFL